MGGGHNLFRQEKPIASAANGFPRHERPRLPLSCAKRSMIKIVNELRFGLDIKEKPFRTDIQALRGYAVLIVVLYHAGVPTVGHGYLGVDIFFTISGFLITSLILRGLREDCFSFCTFYMRRARRLLPAACTVLFVVTLLSSFLLSATQYREFLSQLLSAPVFLTNVTLWMQTGYFSADSAFRPLLHMWSLAVEEQYYLIIPLFIFITPKRFRLPFAIVGTVSSFLMCIYFMTRSPSAAFYLLPTRAWEMGIGSIGAFLTSNRRVRVIAYTLLPGGLLLLLAAPVVPQTGPHPGIAAAAVCCSTLIVLLAESGRLNANAMSKGLSFMGNFSYSLYLIHWPLLSIARVVYLSKILPWAITSLIVFLSFVIAYVLFRFVEKPFRDNRFTGVKIATSLISGFGATLLLGFFLSPSVSTTKTASFALAAVEGLSADVCQYHRRLYNGECRQAGSGHVLLWGDSYSMHLVPGLTATMNDALDEASLGHCSPLLDYAALPSENERQFSLDCMDFSTSVIEYIKRTPEIRTVVISAQYARTLNSAGGSAIERINGVVRVADLGLKPTVTAQKRTVSAIRDLGRRVVVVSPTPPNELDLGQCWERISQGKPILGQNRQCRIQRANLPKLWQEQEELLLDFETKADVPVIRLDRAFCDDAGCITQEGDQPLFRDAGHLSTVGSLYVGRRLDLGQLIDRVAR